MAYQAMRWCHLAAGLALITGALGLGPPGWLFVSSQLAWAQAPEPESHDAAQIFNFSVDANSRMTVPVTIGTAGPFPFIVDTASTRTVIARELADQLDLRDGPRTKVHSMSDMETTRTVIIPSLLVNGRTLKAIAAPALGANNIGAAGILGLDALKAQHVVVDFATATMAITASSQPPAPEEWQGEMIVVTAKNRFGQLVLADASVDDERVYVIIDTGGEVSLGNEALRQKLFGSKKPRAWKKIELLSATGGTTVADATTVDRLRIAGLRITGLPIAFADAHPFHALNLTKQPALLLGMDTLRTFDRVTLDFAKKKISFMWTGLGNFTIN